MATKQRPLPRRRRISPEVRVYVEQERLIRRVCGKRAADRANYGWSVEGSPSRFTVCTKVYGEGVLVSSYAGAGRIAHRWEDLL